MSNRYDGTLLDDVNRYGQLDPAGMTRLVETLPRQCSEAAAVARETTLPDVRGISNVVILGMGGSAIGGNLFKHVYEDELPVPVAVNTDYTVPAYVGPDTLVVASSYSGNTEETLAAYDAANAKGARLFVISTGGLLAQRAQQGGHPWLRIAPGMQPRAALGYSLFTLVVLFDRLGLLKGTDAHIAEAVDVLYTQRDRMGHRIPLEHNKAKQIAAAAAGKAVLVYGSGSWRGMAAYRWKCQVNENSKALCFWNTFPELNHNETVGWEFPSLTKDVYSVVLRDRADDERTKTRVNVTQRIMAPRIGGQTELWSVGESKLARLMSLVYPGDFVSLYLGLLYGVDPTPVAMIDLLKKELAALDG